MKKHINEIVPLLNKMLEDAVNSAGHEIGVENFVWVLNHETINQVRWNDDWSYPRKILGIRIEENPLMPVGEIECRYVVGKVEIE